jgi:hypothetical protein
MTSRLPLRSARRRNTFTGIFHALLQLAAAAAPLLVARYAHAAVPAGYTGTPYKGTPQAIPGRVELADMDLGGINVAWYADHNRMNSAGYEPISGNDYRPDDKNLPNICKTNRAFEVPGEGSEDFWEDGKRYPSEDNKFVYYMGYAHTVDWVRVTVNVAKAGKYNVSSNWACANNPCGLSLWFNDGTGAPENPDRPLDGQNKSGIVKFDATNDYHKWRAYPNFTQVELSAGVQVMTFNLEQADHLQYGFLQFDPVDGPIGGAGAGAGGAAGAGTGGSPAAGSGSAGTPGAGGAASGGTPGAGGTGITTPSGGTGITTPSGGTGITTTPSGGSGGATSGLGSNTTSNQDGGCTLTSRGAAGSGGLAALLLASGLLLGRRAKLKR